MKQNAFSLVAYLLHRKTNVIYFHLRLSRLFCLSVPFFDPTVVWLEPLRAHGSPLHAGWWSETVPAASLFTYIAYVLRWEAGHWSTFSFSVTWKLEEVSDFACCWICLFSFFVTVNAALQEQIQRRVMHLSGWRHEQICQPFGGRGLQGAADFRGR